MSNFQTLVGRAIADSTFAATLLEDPESTLAEIGITPTPEMLNALQGIDVEALQQLARAFGEDKAAF